MYNVYLRAPYLPLEQLIEHLIGAGDGSGGDEEVRVLRVRGLLEHFFELFDLAPSDATNHKDNQVLVVCGTGFGMKAKLAVQALVIIRTRWTKDANST